MEPRPMTFVEPIFQFRPVVNTPGWVKFLIGGKSDATFIFFSQL